MGVRKKDNLVVSVHSGARWVKPAQPAELMLLTQTLLMGALRARSAEPASLIYRVEQKNDNTFYLRIFQKLWFLYLVHIMTKTFNTIDDSFKHSKHIFQF